MAPGPALATDGLGSQPGHTWAPPSPAQVAAICRSLYSLCQVAPDRTQAEAGLGLHFPGYPRAGAPSRQLQTTLEHHLPTTSTSDTVKGTQRAPEPC